MILVYTILMHECVWGGSENTYRSRTTSCNSMRINTFTQLVCVVARMCVFDIAKMISNTPGYRRLLNWQCESTTAFCGIGWQCT